MKTRQSPVSRFRPLLVPGLAVILAAATLTQAKMPVQRLLPNTVGVEFTLAERRAAITRALVPTEEDLRMVSVYYAPVPNLALSLGLGGDRFSVEEYQDQSFKGGYGLTPSIGAHLASPVFLDKVVRICADIQALYLNSADDSGFEYRAAVLYPSAGLLLHFGPWVDLELGARWHVINGTMVSGEGGADSPFSNDPYMRGFAALSAVSPSGVYLRIDFAAAQGAIEDRFKDGLDETSLALEIGVLLFKDDRIQKTQERNNKYFPRYGELKEREKELEEKMK